MIKIYRIIDITKNAVILCCLYKIFWLLLFPAPEMPVRYAVMLQLIGFGFPVATLCLLQIIFRFCIQKSGGALEKLPRHKTLIYSLLASIAVTTLLLKPILWFSMYIFRLTINS
jgi:hypothetical protein